MFIPFVFVALTPVSETETSSLQTFRPPLPSAVIMVVGGEMSVRKCSGVNLVTNETRFFPVGFSF